MRLKIRTNTMLKTKHSWSITILSILRELEKLGHDLYIVSTDGYPDDEPSLKRFFNRDCEEPDIDFCYTLPQNWKSRFKPKSKIKASIFNYETSVVPEEWRFELKHVDFVLPSSNFCMEIFKNNGWDQEKLKYLPLGFDDCLFDGTQTYDLPQAKSFKFLTVAINHYRKNIDKLVEGYYKSFTKNDDVSLILKTNLRPPKTKFECNVIQIINDIQKQFDHKNLPSLILLDDKIKNISGLYNSSDVFISTSSSEGFGLPFLEAMAAKKLIIAPRATGQLDFLNDENSIFLNMSKVPADPNIQYWKASKSAITYMPNTDDISRKMLLVKNNYNLLYNKFSPNFESILLNFTWRETAKKLVNLYDNI